MHTVYYCLYYIYNCIVAACNDPNRHRFWLFFHISPASTRELRDRHPPCVASRPTVRRYGDDVSLKGQRCGAESWLVGGFNHLEKYEFVNGKDDIPYIIYIIWKIKNVWNHQPDNVAWVYPKTSRTPLVGQYHLVKAEYWGNMLTSPVIGCGTVVKRKMFRF